MSSTSVKVVLGALLLASTPGGALAHWSMRLPVPPNLPRPPVSGYAPVNGVRIWYGIFGTSSRVGEQDLPACRGSNGRNPTVMK